MFVKDPFPLDSAATEALEAALSPPRLSTYVRAAGGDLREALRLHGWNTAIGSAFFGPLQHLEVALRNAQDRELGHVFGASWHSNPQCLLTAHAAQQILEKRAELQRSRQLVDTPHLIAELSFGFWVALLNRSADDLWRRCLHRAFRHHRLRRDEAHRRLDHLRRLRNRIAHHEPIFARHLRADHQSLLTVVGWICPTTRDWIAHHSRVEPLLALRPGECPSF